MLKKTILVTGANGYIGNAIVQRLLSQGHNVVGIDNQSKLDGLKECKSISAIDVEGTRTAKLERLYPKYIFYLIDVNSEYQIDFIFNKFDFDTVINLAQTPSAPYSQIDLNHASFSIQNNTIGCLNILWMMKQYCPDAHLIEIESLGTFNPAINTDIPEGKFQFEYNGRKSEPSIFPKAAASFYHASKVFNTYLNDCANRWWGIKSTIINQGVVYGSYTDEINKTQLHSHFSADECFGTVLNRFIVQAMLDIPLTVYGDGEQKRGFLALNDSIQCLDLFVHNPPEDKEMRIVNQLDESFSMNQLADKVIKVGNQVLNRGVTKQHIESPRVEKTTDHYYNPETDTLKRLGFKQTRTVEDEIKYSFQHINTDNLEYLKELVLPKISWR